MSESEAAAAATPSDDTAPDSTAPDPAVPGLLRTVAVVALLGAATIHFAYAPSHFDAGAADGWFFVVAAWAQFGALAALWQWRDSRLPWLAAAAVSLGVTLVWLVSRTSGVPGQSSQEVGWADGVATALQLVVLAVSVTVLLSDRLPALEQARHVPLNPVVGAAVAVAVLAGVSVTFVPSVGHDHDHDHGHGHGDEVAGHAEHAGHGDDAGHGEHAGHDHGPEQPTELVAAEARCDVEFNTAAFNEESIQAAPEPHDDDGDHAADFTIEEWAEVFVEPEDENPMASGIEDRQMVLDFLTSEPALEEGVLSGGLAHSLDPDPWRPLTDHEECTQLADELERTRQVAERYPTAQDALDGGYRMVTPYLPSIASHYINTSYVNEFDLDNPGMLLYDGNGTNASIVGISHYQFSDEYPEDGYTGGNDHWHRHMGLCMADGLVVGGTNLTEEECADRGGSKMEGGNQWMSHTWVVPGCESDYGMFSGANPALVARGSTATRDPFNVEENTEDIPSGCGSGLAVDADLDLDEGGHGPSLNR